jgi:hypothetical protein
MRYCVQPATSTDVAFLAMVLDETSEPFVDRADMNPADRLLRSCAFSAQIWTARDLTDGTPAALWGVAPQPDDPGVGHLWMLAAEPFDQAPGELEALSRLVLAEMLGEFPRLENYIDARRDRALELLRAIGFTVEPGVHHPDTDKTLHHVWIDSDGLGQLSAYRSGTLYN